MRLKTCTRCGMHFLASDSACPNCNNFFASRNSFALTAALLGISLVACGDKATDTGQSITDSGLEDSAVDTADTNVEPPYGVGDLDEDGDGWSSNQDCDDFNSMIHPGAAELDSAEACMKDEDGDGYGDNSTGGIFVAGTDCDDSNAAVHPAATEIAEDGIDQNCDGVDE